MAREKVDLKESLKNYRYEMGLLQRINCSREENKKYRHMLKEGMKLPEGVFQYQDQMGTDLNEFYTIYKADLTKDELNEFLEFKKLSMIKTIKNCAVFFVLLTIVTIIINIIVAYNITIVFRSF